MNYTILSLLVAALALIHCLVGGTRLLYSVPSYGLLALAGVLTIASIRRVRSAPNPACLASVAVLAGYVLVRACQSPVVFLAGPDFFMMTGCVLLYLLIAYFFPNPNNRAVVIAALLTVGIADAVLGLIQFTQGKGFMLFGFGQPSPSSRANGMLISPDHLAGFLEVVGVLGLSVVVWGRTKFAWRLVLGYAVFCCYAGLIFTGSRGGYLSALVSLVVFCGLSLFTSYRADRGRSIVLSVLSVCVVAGLVIAAVKMMTSSLVLQGRVDELTTPDTRFLIWHAALDQFRLAPWFGTGSGTYLIFGRFFRNTEVQADPVHVHNDYLELLAEYGILGAVVMALFLAAHLFAGTKSVALLARHRLRASPDGLSTAVALQIGALSAVAALLAHSVVDFNLHIPGNALLLAFVFGILSNPGVVQGEGARTSVVTPWFRYALPFAGLCFLGAGLWQVAGSLRAGQSLRTPVAWQAAMILPKMPGEYWTEQARIALRDRAFVKCADAAKTGLGFEKKNPDLYLYLGEANRMQALQMQQRHSRALEQAFLHAAEDAYRHGLELFPNDETLLVRLAQTMDGQKRFDEAEALFIEAFKADPNLGLTRAFYGAHLRKMGRNEEAAEQYRRARFLSDRNVSLVGLRELGIPDRK